MCKARKDRAVNVGTGQLSQFSRRHRWRKLRHVAAVIQQVLRSREDAIITSVNRLLANKGFDLMTVDEVAADVGIAKASL